MVRERSTSSSKETEEIKERTAFEFAWQINSYLNEYIQFADTKAGTIIIFFTFTIGLYTSLWPREANFALLLVGVGLSLIPMLLALAVITPRLPKPAHKGLLFWRNITEFKTSDDYIEGLKRADYLKEIAQQNYILAQVAHRKYTWLQWAICAACVALLYLVSSFVWMTKR